MCVVCVYVLGGVYVCLRDRNRQRQKEREKTTETEREFFFFQEEKIVTDICFSFHRKKTPCRSTSLSIPLSYVLFLRNRVYRGPLSPVCHRCSVGAVAQAPPLQWMLQAGMVASPLCSCLSCTSEWAPWASQG